MRSGAGERAARVLPWVGLLALVAAFSFQDIRTWDYWWHLRTGGLIAAQGEVPKYDLYTFTVPGNRWIDVHWLHQLGLHAVHSLGGHAAVVWAKFAFALLITGLLAFIGFRRERPAVSAAALALMLMVAADRFMPRPELTTFACLAAVLALLDRHARRGDAWVWAVVPVQLLWVNVHGLFAVGIAVCGMYVAAELMRPLVSPGERLRWGAVRRLCAVTLASLAVSLLNPNFLDGALYPVMQLGMIGSAEERSFFGFAVQELLPPIGFDATLPAPQLALFFGLAAFALVAMVLNWSRIHAADPLLWVAFMYLALSAKRNLALFALVAAPIAVRNLNEWLDGRIERGAPRAPPRRRMLSALVATLALLALTADVVSDRFFERFESARSSGFGVVDFLYPEGAVDWIEEMRPPGPIAHSMADGGYLNWRLFPDYRVMVDGRLEVYGAQTFLALQMPSPEHFRRLDEVHRFGAVLVHYSLEHSDSLLWWLHLNSNWQLAYVDDTAALYVRVQGGTPPRWRERRLDDPGLFPPFPEGKGAVDRKRRVARTAFYAAMRRYERALEIWEEALERYPELAAGRLTHARLLHYNGLVAASEAILRELLEENPRDAELYLRIGELRLESEDLDEAERLFDAALGIDPQLAAALYQRGHVRERQGDLEAAVRDYMGVLTRTLPGERTALLARERLRVLMGRAQPLPAL